MAANRIPTRKHPFKLAPRNHRIIAWFFIILTGVYIYSCTYFKVKQATVPSLQESIQKSKVTKTFYLHQGSQVYGMDLREISNDQIYGQIKGWTPNPHYRDGRSSRYEGHESTIVHEVHIYVDSTVVIEKGEIYLPADAIDDIKVMSSDTGQELINVVVVPLAIIAMIAIIGLLTKSSCPYIYAHNGEYFAFEGEIYGGAIGKNLERDDYMPLPTLRPDDDLYRLRLSNELKERQYTDLANLLVAEHPPGTKVLIDQNGEMHGMRALSVPIRAIANDRDDISGHLQYMDQFAYAFDDPQYPVNEVTLEFDKPADVDRGHLVLDAKNTLWFDYQFGQFLEKLGGSFDDWMAQEAKLTTEERLKKGEERFIPLSVYVKVGVDWQLADRLHTIGPLAYRNMVVPLDLAGLSGDKVQVKLVTGFMFWEMDYAGISFDEDPDIQVQRLLPTSAGSFGKTDAGRRLANTDGVYLEQLYTGDLEELAFMAPNTTEGKATTVFLHTRGYYELVRDFKGPPKMVELLRYRDPLWMAEVSQLQYLATMNYDQQMAHADEP